MSSESENELEYKLLTKDKVEDALAIQAETMKLENLAIGLGMFEEDGAPEEMNLLFREIIKDGTTLVAVDKKTDELVFPNFGIVNLSLRFSSNICVCLKAKPRAGEKDELEVFIEENLRYRTCRELVKFLDDVSVSWLLAELLNLDRVSASIYSLIALSASEASVPGFEALYIQNSVDIFESYDTKGAMELFYLGTNPRYQGRGIGRQMVQNCIEFGRGLLNGTMKRTSIDGSVLDQHVLPEVIFGLFASNYSQKIADQLNFKCLREIRYDDYTFAGRKMSERIGSVHKTARLQALKL
ncbi:hypothetical protein WN48_08159 [Eufriesea mexicana]|uniref:N-acetyltransferase domain-containing protein n=1 Tax=Eufriesea mexicana TaxID=516756 RepID=A0A310SKJ3_9HYME|nr:hypothetical protein WN48_08159 [Eufriesea mexicana]